ncbi:MAG: hypothetical protein ABI041_10630 [Bdellovibrionia bacterium]
MTRKIIKMCDPKDCMVIGIGRSPTPLIATLQNLHSNYASSIPLSNFRYNESNPLSKEDSQKLFLHFSNFLPNETVRNGRKLMIIDYSLSGASIESAKDYFLKYYSHQKGPQTGAMPVVESTAIATSAFNSGARRLRADQVIIIPTDSDLAHHFVDGKFDACAEYGKFTVTVDPLPSLLEKNPLFLNYKKKLKKQLSISACSIPTVLRMKRGGKIVE